MKTIRFIIFLGLFIGALYVGYHMGFSSPAPVMPVEAKRPAETSMVSAAPVLASGQISLLVVTVDDLTSARPRLESAWMLEFVPPDPRLTLLSVYPSFSSNDSQQDASLVSAFRVEASADTIQVGQAFLKVLQDRKFFWNGAVLIDKYALAQILDYFNRPQPEQSLNQQPSAQPVGYPDGAAKVASIPSASQNAQMALFAQAAFFQDLCQSASQRAPLLDSASQDELGKLLENHYASTLAQKQILTHLKAFLSDEAAVFCVFPTLPIQPMSAR